MYHPYDRQKSRDRSRDRERKFNNRSPSEDQNVRQYKQRSKYGKGRGKRVKFEGQDDIRVFKKEDEPAAKGLTEEDLLKIKAEIQKEIAKSYDFNWEHYKHRDALLENHSIKEQKEKEKALSEKLMAAKESLQYFSPARLLKCEGLIERGCDSVQSQGHTERIHDILGCYYTHASQIPNQPQFEILNTNTISESKTIKFDNHLFEDRTPNHNKNTETTKPIKGILKVNNHELIERNKNEPRIVDPHLINILKDFKINPQLYTKEKTEQLLKPYRDSGQLDYLMKNKEVLQAMLKNTSQYSTTQPKPAYQMTMTPISNQSAERSSSQQPQPQTQQQYQPQPQPNGMGYNHTFVPKADKFRTVPCKYFHSPQGCSKVDNCTFIHDQRFVGASVPNTNFTPTPPPTQPNPRMTPTPYPPSNYGYSMPPMNTMNPNISPNPNYYRQPVGYPPASNPNYYGNPPPQGPINNYQGYPMNKAPNQYMQGQYGMNNPPPQQLPQSYNPTQQQQSQPYSNNPPQQSQAFGQSGAQFNGPPPGQGYGNNPNYQYYIGNNANK